MTTTPTFRGSVSGQFRSGDLGAKSGASLTALADGRFILTWEEFGDAHDSAPHSDIIARFVDHMGRPLGSPFLVNAVTGGNETAPATTALAGGGFVTVYVAGADTMQGGTGTDTVDYSGQSTGVVVNLATRTTFGGDATGDVLGGIEVIIGTQFSDAMQGSTSAERLAGGSGNDRLSGGAGSDTLDGGSGDDQIEGGSGSDILFGGIGTDTLMFGGETASGAVASLTTGKSQSGLAFLTDVLTGFENLTGSSFADRLTGDAGSNLLQGQGGDDVLEGQAGRDALAGGAGRDRLDGGTGNDELDGGADADVFVFGLGSGADRVARFDDGLDRIDLTGTLTLSGLDAILIPGGLRLIVQGSPADTLDLIGVSLFQIGFSDFI